MAYSMEEIKKGIKVHYIETNKFKTNIIVGFLTIPLSRDTVTLNTMLPAILKRGTQKLTSQEQISIELENMYGATFDCGIEKIGDNQMLKFYIEVLNDCFVPGTENLLKKSIELLLEIIFNPLVENKSFKQEYVSAEKNNIKQLIEAKIDNKDKYAYERCIEEMYKDQKYGIYKYGYTEDLENIDAHDLYEHYKKLIQEAKIDIFISGDLNKQEVSDILKQNENISKLNERKDIHVVNSEETEIKADVEEKQVEESKEVSQGKLVIGLDIANYEKDSKYIKCLYNVILGESATSKLFQNVREKASLAYSARSNYIRQKNNIYIRCGIEIDKFNEAIEIIKQQLDDMKNGNFSEDDLKNAKIYMSSGIRTIEEEQDSEITYYIAQELSGNLTTFKQYEEKINNVTREQIIKMAQNIKINTIYFLKN